MTMAERISQARKITALKGHLTRLINKIQNILCQEEFDKDELIDLKETLFDRRDILIDEINAYIDELHLQKEEEEIKRRENEINVIDDKIEFLTTDINNTLKDLKMTNKSKSQKQQQPECQLERITLPRFNGKEYFQWKAIFDVVIDEQSWPDRIKFIRLMSCLDGAPRELLSNYPPVDASYHRCLNRLEQVYGGPERRVADAIRKVRSGRTIEEENLPELRRYITVLEAAEIALGYDDDELRQGGALYQCARERLSSSLTRNYLKWALEKDVSESFQSLTTFLTIWSKVIEGTPSEHNIKRNRPPILSHTIDNDKRNCRPNKDNFVIVCPWHKKEHGSNESHFLDRCADFKALSVKQRRDFIYVNRLCKICFKKNHIAKNCRNQRALCRRCKGSNNTHHFLLHEDRNDSNGEIPVESIENNNCQDKKDAISLQTVPVIVRNGEKQIKINALLDSGSNCSFLSKEIVKTLGLKEFDHETRTLHMMNVTDQALRVSKVKFELASVDGRWVRTECMLSVPNILLKSKPVSWQKYKEEWSHLRSISFPDLAPRDHHEMLIGSDLIFYHRSRKEVCGLRDAPIARLTPLGWSCIGRYMTCNTNIEVGVAELECCQLEMDLNDQVSKMWRLDAIGIDVPANEAHLPTEEERIAEEMLERGLTFKDGRYEAPMLWQDDHPKGNNFEAVYRRTKNMEHKMQQRGNVVQRCSEVIKGYKDKGYIVEVSDERKYENAFYIPHFPIVKEEKVSSKVRIVFDAAAKYNGMSLNDRLYAGPKYQQDIVKILINFRKFRFGLLCDLSEMYLQVSLASEDRRFCRFIWQDKIYEWTRTVFGRRDSPFIVLYVVKQNASKFNKKFPKAVKIIQSNMYVDDLAASCQSEGELMDLIHQITEIFAFAGMKVHKWNTNSREVLKSIPDELKAKTVEDILKDDLPTTKILGLSWDAQRDVLFFTIDIKEPDENDLCTKRQILKTLARIYDPLGYLTPFLITARVIFQKVWTERTEWDEPVSQELKLEWLAWHRQLKELRKITIPRFMGLEQDNRFEIHVFSDASKDVYCACVYLKVGDRVSLVACKARVTPLKAQSIPRLELMAATLAVRLAKNVCAALDVDLKAVTFWVDAADILYWIKRPAKQFKPFVSNRVGEIQAVTDSVQWRYCPTKINPADIPTRMRTVKDLEDEVAWWSGPEFLKLPKEEWPRGLEERQAERSSIQSAELAVCAHVAAGEDETEDDFALNASRWSNVKRLVRRMAYVLRFIARARKVSLPVPCDGQHLHPEELRQAEQRLIKLCQMEAFSDERAKIEHGLAVPKKSKLVRLNPFIDDDGLLRSRSRLHIVSWLEKDFKCPMILPKKHALTRLIVSEAHMRIGHAIGQNAVLNDLNQRFWIVGAKGVLNKVQSGCLKCKIERAKVLQPAMGPIPEFRLSKPLRAFNVTSVDFAGPYFTKRGRGQARNKRYLALFTCLQIRAVHLEVVASLETSSFLNAFARFISRRGCPEKMLSDNGKTFVRADKEIRAKMLSDQDRIISNHKKIVWQFLPPYSPNMGGVHEIMVKSAKRALRHILVAAEISDEELETAVVQAEGLLNSRPLTKASGDVQDELCLTPNHFLFGRANPGNVLEEVDKGEKALPLSRRWKYVQALVQHFWLRWQREVLHSYRTRTKWLEDQPNLKCGDVVMILDSIEVRKRNWRLGIIENIFTGRDERVRVVDVRTDGKVYRRPVNKLCLLVQC